MVHTLNPSAGDAKAGQSASGVPGQPVQGDPVSETKDEFRIQV